MDPKKPAEDLEFDLEDIIREFSQKDPDTDALVQQMFAETPSVQLPKSPVPEEAAPAAEEPAPPAEEPPAEEAVAVPETAEAMPQLEAEPFSEAWEPEYEEPMGEYTPQEPIAFPVKNRTRMLREKLVAGPEKRYQDLSAAGVTGMNVCILLQLILTVLSIGATFLLTAQKISVSRPLLFCQLLAVLVSALLGCPRLLGGMGSLLRGQFTLNTLLCITFAVSMLDAYACLGNGNVPLSGLFCLHMLMAQISARQQRLTELGQMDTLRKANDLTAVVRMEDYYEKRPGYVTVPGEPKDFMQHYAAPSAPEKALWRYSLVALAISVALGLYAGFRVDLETGIRACTTALLIALPATAHVSISRPAMLVQKRLSTLGAVLCGWYGIRYAEKNAIYPVNGADLFPYSSIKLNGVKFYGSVDPGWVTSSAVALLAANQSGLQRAFEQLPRGRDGLNHLVEDMTCCDGGISGLVSGVPTLLGTAEFMEAMQVVLPREAVIADAVYVVVDGELSGVCALSYGADQAAVAGLRNLNGWHSLAPVLISGDFLLSPRFVREKLGVKPRRLAFPDRQLRQQLQQLQPAADAPVLALTTKPGLAAKTFAVNGAWTLRSAMSLGANLHLLAGVLGLLLVALMTLLLAFDVLSPDHLLLYSLCWMVPGWLVTERARFL